MVSIPLHTLLWMNGGANRMDRLGSDMAERQRKQQYWSFSTRRSRTSKSVTVKHFDNFFNKSTTKTVTKRSAFVDVESKLTNKHQNTCTVQ